VDARAVSSFHEPDAVREHLAGVLGFWLSAHDERHGDHVPDHEHGGRPTAPAPRSERHGVRTGDAVEPDYHPVGASAEVLRPRAGRSQLQGQVKGLNEEVPHGRCAPCLVP
jgi:hypothetical protein